MIPTDAKDLEIWEDICDQARGIIGRTILDSLQVHIKLEDSPTEVWKILTSLFDKSGDVYAYYVENKIHELDPKYFDRIESFIYEIKTYNEKLNNHSTYYKRMVILLLFLLNKSYLYALIFSSK